MKKIIYSSLSKTVLLMSLLIVGSSWLDAQTILGGDIAYTITSKSPATVKVSNNRWFIGEAKIPTTINYNDTIYTVTSIDDYAFNECQDLTSITIPNSVISIGSNAFYNCPNLTTVTISDSLTSIGESAFHLCAGLTSVKIPNSVTTIGAYAFRYCSSLKSVTLPNSLTSINNDVFYGCTGLTSITIPNSVTSIGTYAFYYCTGLTSLKIPNSITSIESAAFYYCLGLTSVSIDNATPLTIDPYVFEGVKLTKPTLYVPAGSEAAYHNATGWKDFGAITAIPTCTPNTGATTLTGCGFVTYGDSIYTSSKVFTDTLLNAGGCDSVLTVTIKVNKLSDTTVINVIAFQEYNFAMMSFTQDTLVYSVLANETGCDSLFKTLINITYLAGDIDGNDLINNKEIAGDVNFNGVIDGEEICGDVNGNFVIDINEVGFSAARLAGFGNEIAGDRNGNGIIDGDEIAGDADGDGKIDAPEFLGDRNGDTNLNQGEINGDANGDGMINNGEVTALTDVNSTEAITIFPNPTSEMFTIQNATGVVNIHNAMGEVVMTLSSANETINISHLKSGVYFVSVNGKVLKVIKE